MEFFYQVMLLFLMAFISNTKILIQGKCGRNLVQNTVDCISINGLLFGFAGISFLLIFFKARIPSVTTIFYAAAFGITSVIFQMTYLNALKCGSISLTVLITNFSVIPTSLFGVIVYNEAFSKTKVLGLLLIIIIFFLITKKGKDEKSFNVRWLMLSILASASFSLTGIVQKMHQKTEFYGERTLFVTYAYLIAFIVSVLIVGACSVRHCHRTFKFQPKLLIMTGIAGLLLGIYQVIALWLAKRMDSMVMYPIQSCSAILVSLLLGTVIFKDKLSIRQWIAAAIGVISVALVSI